MVNFEQEGFELTFGEIRQFRKNGHILLRGLCPAAVIEVARPMLIEAAQSQGRAVIDHFKDEDTAGPSTIYKSRVAAWLEDSGGEAENRSNKPFVRVHNLWQRDEQARRFVMSSKFAKVAADLLGVPSVRLFQDSIFIKQPGDGISPWHRDQDVVPLDTDKFVTFWIPLNNATANSGTLFFASGSHFGTGMMEDEDVWSMYDVARPVDLSMGDATAHLGWTLHAAGPNQTQKPREAIQLIYFADGSKLTSDPTLEYGDDMLTLMRWAEAGNWGPNQVVANEWCPVVWPPQGSSS